MTDSLTWSGIGFLVGYFVMYSIRAGSKTQDAFKSLLGAGGLAGGALLSQPYKDHLFVLESSVLWGAGSYFALAILLSLLFSVTKRGGPKPANNKEVNDAAMPANNKNCLAVVLGRILLGEDFRTPSPR